MRSTSTSALVAALLAIAPANAFWRLPCVSPLLFERADPIVNPGTVSAHSHTIMGGNGFGFDMNYASTQASTCSSCTVTKDLSNYWVPNLYYKGQDGTFTNVEQVGGGLMYYLQRSDPKDPEYSSGLLAFPEGFRMLAGDPMLRSFSDTLEQRAVSFACLGTNTAETHEMPNINCPNGLRAQIFFPSCWDGVNLDSPDHKSHMAYPSRVDNGFCPDSHPKRFISLFYEVVWDTPKFASQWNGPNHPFVFSNGDETGYGYHGDFVNGWDVPTLQRAVNECTNLSGNVEDCPVFDFFTNDFANGCKIAPSIDEKIKGTLSALPGCNPSTGEGSRAVAQHGCGAPTTISAPENPFVDLTVSKQFAYIGCGTDNLNGRTLTGPSQDKADMTIEQCVDFCNSQGFTVAGTEFSTQCYCGNDVPADRAPIDGIMGDCFMKCGGDSTENCGGAGTISLYKKCDGTCQNVSYNVNNSTLPGNPGSGNAGAGTDSSNNGSIETKVDNTTPVATVPVVKAPVPTAPATAAQEPNQPAPTSIPAAGPVVEDPKEAAVDPVATPTQKTVPPKAVVQKTITVFPVATPVVDAEEQVDLEQNQNNAQPELEQNNGNAQLNQCGAIVTVTVAEVTVTVTEITGEPTTNAAAAVPTTAPTKNGAVADINVPSNEGAISDIKVSSKEGAVPTIEIPTSFPTLSPSATAPYTNGTKHNGNNHGHGHKHPHQKPPGGYAKPTNRRHKHY